MIFRFGETGMHIGTECLVSFGVSFGLPKDSILVDKFSFIINQLLEAGLTRKWFNDAMDDVAKSSKAAQKPENAPFTLEQLQVRTIFLICYMHCKLHISGSFLHLALRTNFRLCGISVGEIYTNSGKINGAKSSFSSMNIFFLPANNQLRC